jgi:2'-5' RNA ligase
MIPARRLFVGISLPQEYARIVARLQQSLQSLGCFKIGWVPPPQIHVTLSFLGQIEDVRLQGLIDALAGIRSKPYQFCAGGGGFFPRNPPLRVIWAGCITGSQETKNLAATIGDRMVRSGYIKAAPALTPHLTLGRIRKSGYGPWELVRWAIDKQKWPQFTVDGFTLWESVLGPEQAVHHALAVFPLTDS